MPDPAPHAPAFDAIVVAGGRGSRLGGVVKADLDLGSGRLLAGVLDAARAARTRVVVGDVAVPDGVLLTREDPPGGGPASGVVAGLRALARPSPWTLLLAVDLPDAPAAVAELLAAASAGIPAVADGLCLLDEGGRLQWLLGLYRTDALARAADAVGTGHDVSMRRLLSPLRLEGVRPRRADVGDVDTWEDVSTWGRRLGSRPAAQLAVPSEEARMPRTEDRSSWRPFIERASAAAGVDPASVDEDLILGLTADIAHRSVRPMAPVGAFILGVAAGGHPDADVASLADRLRASLPKES